jgi:two-component system response regulator (stage 0 sporulation protein F)
VDCEDGDKGIEIFLENKIDVVLTDIAMPEKDGVEVLIEIKSVSPSIKVIAMSGVRDCEKLLAVAQIYKADATIKKPFEKEDVLSVVKRVCRNEKD